MEEEGTNRDHSGRISWSVGTKFCDHNQKIVGRDSDVTDILPIQTNETTKKPINISSRRCANSCNNC